MAARTNLPEGFFKTDFVKSLSKDYKLLWVYILNESDFAGVFHPELDVAGIRLDAYYNEAEILTVFTGQIVILNSGKWFIPSKVLYNYPNGLSASQPVHANVFKRLIAEHVEEEAFTYFFKSDKSKKAMLELIEIDNPQWETSGKLLIPKQEPKPIQEHILKPIQEHTPIQDKLEENTVTKGNTNNKQTEHTGTHSEATPTAEPQSFKTDSVDLMSTFEAVGMNSTKDEDYINRWASQFSKDVGQEEIDTLRTNWTGYIDKNPILKKSIDSSVANAKDPDLSSFIHKQINNYQSTPLDEKDLPF